MLQKLFKFKGGLTLPHYKQVSSGQPIARAPLPGRLTIPLSQSAGGAAHPVVAAGDKVLKGQLIGKAEGWISAAVHASSSGTVIDVTPCRMPHPSGLSALAVVIEPDGEDRWVERQPIDYKNMAPEAVRQALQDAGVVGLGGATFPSHAKIKASSVRPTTDLILNGAECEPFITCDDRLMREEAKAIVSGIGVIRDLLQPGRVLIGIEDNKPEAIAAMRTAVSAAGESFVVVAVPTRYPAGSMKQLIRVLTGREIPVDKLSTDLGIQCFNVATAFSIWRALAYGEPVVSRIVTLTGNVENPGNWEVPLGTPMNEALRLARPKDDTDGIIMGGPMMGFPVPALDVPVIKSSNCLIARSPALFPPRQPEMPCIRCGACTRACPQELLPFELYWWSRARQFDKAREYQLANCIECGCCSYVCPAHIPLVQYFRFAKGEIRAQERDQAAAERARARFEFRQFREEREKAEKAEKLARAAAAQAAKKVAEAAETRVAPDSGNAAANDDAAKEAVIAAALERSRAEKAAAQAPVATDTMQDRPDTDTPRNDEGKES
jgi:electron transport complex protein RnfC